MDRDEERRGRGQVVYIGANRKVIVPGGERIDTKIIQCEDSKGKPYLAAGCAKCDSLRHVYYADCTETESIWRCATCKAEYRRPDLKLASAIYLPPEKGLMDIEIWIETWLCYPEGRVRVEVT